MFVGQHVSLARQIVLTLIIASSACSLLFAGCGNGVGPEGKVVGGTCSASTVCAGGSFCLSGGDFPSGTCSVRCSKVDPSCPAGSTCVDKEGGVCLLTCGATIECRPGYQCKGKRRIDDSGEALVCIE